jgi:hypothetical protein
VVFWGFGLARRERCDRRGEWRHAGTRLGCRKLAAKCQYMLFNPSRQKTGA